MGSVEGSNECLDSISLGCGAASPKNLVLKASNYGRPILANSAHILSIYSPRFEDRAVALTSDSVTFRHDDDMATTSMSGFDQTCSVPRQNIKILRTTPEWASAAGGMP